MKYVQAQGFKVKLNHWYKVLDYEGNLLPGKCWPYKRQRRAGFVWFICVNERGGYVHLKQSEFYAETTGQTPSHLPVI